MNRSELLIYLDGVWQELELSSDIGFVLEYNIAEIKDIAKRKSSFSKTITLPDSDMNRLVLQGLFDSNNVIVSDLDIDTKFILLRDYVEIMSGNILINAVKEDEGQFKYEAVLKSETNQLMKNIGDKELTDLDFSYMNHTYDGENVVATWTASNSLGYFYPLIDYNFILDRESLQSDGYNSPVGLGGLSGLNNKLWRPAIFVRNILDKIIQDAGYNYTSNFFDNNSTYNNLILPFILEDLKTTSDFIRDNSFTVGLTFSGTGLTDPDYDFDFTYADQVLSHNDLINLDQNDLFFQNITNAFPQSAKDGGMPTDLINQSSTPRSYEEYEYFEEFFVYQTDWEFLKLSDELLTPYGDANNLWNTSDYEYTETFTKNQKFRVNLDFWINETGITDIITNAWNPGYVFQSLQELYNQPFTNNTNMNPALSGGYGYVGGLEADDFGNFPPSYDTDCAYALQLRVVRIDESVFPPVVKTIPMVDSEGNLQDELNIYQRPSGDEEINNKYLLKNADGEILDYDSAIVGTQGDASRYNMYFDTVDLDGEEYFDDDGNLIYTAFKLQPNEKVKVQVRSRFLGLRENENFLEYEYNGGSTTSLNVAVFNSSKDSIDSYQPTTPSSGRTYFGNIINESLSVNANIDMNKVLPEKIKQKDFFNSIIKMFNLYVDIDPDNPNNLIIEPRNDFFNSTNIKDWSDKLDLSKEIEQELLYSNPNSYLLTHKKDDKILSLKQYEDTTGKVYGEYEYFRRNDEDFKEKAKQEKIETIFTSPALTENDTYKGLVYPSLVTEDYDKEKRGLYKNKSLIILQRNPNGVIDIENNILKFIKYPVDDNGDNIPPITTTQSVTVDGGEFTTYPYAGHFDNPIVPNSDINYGETDFLYYSQRVGTTKNLYNTYWKNTIEEVANKNSRKITAYFDLNPYDIADFSFKDTIQVNFLSSDANGLYRINKIKYNPQNESTTMVELIKIFDFEVEERSDNELDGKYPIPRQGLDQVSINIDRGNRNRMSNNNSITNGFSNQVASGNFGLISNSKKTVMGSNNKYNSVLSSSYSVVGSNNEFVSNLSGINNNIDTDNTNAAIISGDNNKMGSNNENISIINGKDNKISNKSQNSSLIIGKNNRIIKSNYATSSNMDNNFIYGGKDNTIGRNDFSAFDSGIIGGYTNQISPLGIGTNSGTSSTASNSIENYSYNSFIFGGKSNLISGASNSLIINGQNITVTESNTTWIGNEKIEMVSTDDINIDATNNVDIKGNIINFSGDVFINGGTVSTDKFFIDDDDDTYLIRSNQPSNTFDSSDRQVLLAGCNNSITGVDSFIATGCNNTVSTSTSLIVGGYSNLVSGIFSSVVGGFENVIDSGNLSFIGGGSFNTASNTHNTIGGGFENKIESNCSSILGGDNNEINGTSTIYSSIIGGREHRINGTSQYGTIGGGSFNTINGSSEASIFGGNSNEINSSIRAFIGGGDNGEITDSQRSVMGGGQNNTINNSVQSFLGGGDSNNIFNSTQAFIGGGARNNATASSLSSIIGGEENIIKQSFWSTIGGGSENVIDIASGVMASNYNVVAGGSGNEILGDSIGSGILGGLNNTINNSSSTFIIGNVITADRGNTTFVNNLSIKSIPTSSAGLPSGSVWNDGGTLKIV